MVDNGNRNSCKNGQTNSIVFAKLGDKGYAAGISLKDILKGIEADKRGHLYPLVKPEEVQIVDRKNIPEDYEWSARRVEMRDDWRDDGGVYLLIRNFQEHAIFQSYRDIHREYKSRRLGSKN